MYIYFYVKKEVMYDHHKLKYKFDYLLREKKKKRTKYPKGTNGTNTAAFHKKNLLWKQVYNPKGSFLDGSRSSSVV